jgi:hypothetical protein
MEQVRKTGATVFLSPLVIPERAQRVSGTQGQQARPAHALPWVPALGFASAGMTKARAPRLEHMGIGRRQGGVPELPAFPESAALATCAPVSPLPVLHGERVRVRGRSACPRCLFWPAKAEPSLENAPRGPDSAAFHGTTDAACCEGEQTRSDPSPRPLQFNITGHARGVTPSPPRVMSETCLRHGGERSRIGRAPHSALSTRRLA